MVKDGDLMKDERIGHEDTRNTMTDDNKAAKLVAIKSCYRKFEACLDGKARIKWEKLVDNQETLTGNIMQQGVPTCKRIPRPTKRNWHKDV